GLQGVLPARRVPGGGAAPVAARGRRGRALLLQRHPGGPGRRLTLLQGRTARKASFSSGVPIVTRTPSPWNGRTITPPRSHASANSAERSPSGSQTKLACVSGTSGKASRTAVSTRSRSLTTSVARRDISAEARSAARAAAWASSEAENG